MSNIDAMYNEGKRRFIAICECVNTYELNMTESFTTFSEAVEDLIERMPEYYHRHHWLCKVMEVDQQGEPINMYFKRTGTSKPPTEQDGWSKVW